MIKLKNINDRKNAKIMNLKKKDIKCQDTDSD